MKFRCQFGFIPPHRSWRRGQKRRPALSSSIRVNFRNKSHHAAADKHTWNTWSRSYSRLSRGVQSPCSPCFIQFGSHFCALPTGSFVYPMITNNATSPHSIPLLRWRLAHASFCVPTRHCILGVFDHVRHSPSYGSITYQVLHLQRMLCLRGSPAGNADFGTTSALSSSSR